MPVKGYVGMSVTPEARDGMKALVYTMTGRLHRRVSVSEVMVGLQMLAEQYPEALEEMLIRTENRS